MKTHKMLVITSLALVALLITTGVALAQGSTVDQAIDHVAEGDFSAVSEGKHNNILAMGDAATGGREQNSVSGINSAIAAIQFAGERFPPSSSLELFFNDISLDSSVTTLGEAKFTQDVRIPNIPPGTRVIRAVTGDLEATAGEPPPPPSKPQLQQGQFPLDLVVFNNAQADFFLNNPQWVHPGDKFMIVSANAFSGDNEDYDPNFVNNTARRLLARFPQTEVLATTSGRRNTITAINTVDLSLINIVMTVWEPNNPDFPTAAFNRNDRTTVNRVTRNFAQEMTNLAHARGLQYWMKPTGRSTQDRGKAGVLSYRDIIRITDGMNVQTQGSCVQNTFARAVDGLINDYRATGSLAKGLFVQISLGGSGTNAVTPARAFSCAQVGWSRDPVDAVTMWWASSAPNDARDFLMRREALLQ
jgi:hypothetical protein